MKYKERSLFLVALMFLGMFGATFVVTVPTVSAEYVSKGELYVGWTANNDTYDPVNETLPGVCNSFTVYIKTRNVTDLWGISLWMNYDPSKLNCTAARLGFSLGVKDSDYIVPPGACIINRTKGSLETWDAARMEKAVTVNATLLEVDFHVVGTLGTNVYTNLSITDKPIELRDSGLALIDHIRTDGKLWGPPPPPPGPPTAIINENASWCYVGETIHLWSTSTDASNGTHTILITREDWNITGAVAGKVLSVSGGRWSSIDFTPTSADTYTVLLEVWAIDPMLPPEYQYDNATAIKTVRVKALIYIECFTNKMRRCGYAAKEYGWGPNMSADAYTLDELVTLFAWVVYRNNPMQNRLVSFEVYDAAGNLFLVLQNMTDANGLTWVQFRIPTNCSDYRWVFGKWHCYQKVMLCDEYYTDDIWWDVGWIVELQSVEVKAWRQGAWTPVDTVDMNEPIKFNINLKNIAMNPRNINVSIVVFDDNMVPVILYVYEKTIPGGAFCVPFPETDLVPVGCANLTFPKWTYPGVGRVVVSAWFNGLPSDCGHCCCPDISAEFFITAPTPPPPDPW